MQNQFDDGLIRLAQRRRTRNDFDDFLDVLEGAPLDERRVIFARFARTLKQKVISAIVRRGVNNKCPVGTLVVCKSILGIVIWALEGTYTRYVFFPSLTNDALIHTFKHASFYGCLVRFYLPTEA